MEHFVCFVLSSYFFLLFYVFSGAFCFALFLSYYFFLLLVEHFVCFILSYYYFLLLVDHKK